MKLTIEPTKKVATVMTESGEVPVRVWEGSTDEGVKVYCLVTCVIKDQDQESFLDSLMKLNVHPPIPLAEWEEQTSKA